MKYAEKLKAFVGSNGFRSGGETGFSFSVSNVDPGSTIKEVGDDYIVIADIDADYTIVIPLNLFSLAIDKDFDKRLVDVMKNM